MMKICLLCTLAVASLWIVSAQPNTPATYNAVSSGAHLNSPDPCNGINVQGWQDVPLARVTVDPNFDASVPADYASVWTGNDNNYFFPNGFRKGQVYENNDPPFCFDVWNVQDREVQVMLQTVDDHARLCIKDTSSSNVRMTGSTMHCFTQQYTACFGGLTYSNTLALIVYTDSTAATTATPFWYRVRVSAGTWNLGAASTNSAIDTLEMWCMMQDQLTTVMRFPKDLRSDVPPNTLPTATVNAATTQGASILVAVSVVVAAVVAIFKQ